MNVLITGGAGYIGTELVYNLEADEHIKQIIIYDNLKRRNFNLFLGRMKLNTDKVRFVNGEILDSRKLKKEVDKADVVYHLAAKVTTPFADHNPHEFDQVNNWATAELTYLLEKSNVSKFIYASSASVYGSSKEESDIHTPLNPKTFYGISKMHGEEHVHRLIDSDIQTYVLRLGNAYGYNKSMRFDSVINKFIFEANFYKRIRIFGHGNQYRSFIHIERLGAFLSNLIKVELPPSIYNVVESSYSINEIVDELKNLYPSLEMIFVNQNMGMRSLKVKPDERIDPFMPIPKKELAADLAEFKAQFSF